MDARSLDAMRAAMQVFHSAPNRAAKVFTLATNDNPAVGDGWLGRYATGDQSLAVLEKLSQHADSIGQSLNRISFRPDDLGAFFVVEYVQLPIVDATTARLAYAAALLKQERYQQVDDLVVSLDARNPAVAYLRACLASKTQRWPDVLTAVGALRHCREDAAQSFVGLRPLQRGASLQEAWAAGSLGLTEQALAAVERVLAAPEAAPGFTRAEHPAGDLLTGEALLCKALVLRRQEKYDEAHALLTSIRVQWPNLDRVQAALSDPTLALPITDQETIDSRTDKWNPATETSAEERKAAESERSAKKLLAESEKELAAMVGLDEVKERLTELRYDGIARVLRQRKGMKNEAAGNHVLMVGPPGVGKTVSARIIANMFCGMGLLKLNTVKETRRELLVGRHVGDTENNTRKLLESCRGGTVFFDEFGDLILPGYSEGDPFGNAIISGLVPFMENHRSDTVIIGAGYPHASRRVLDSNAGLRGRFTSIIEFKSYTPEQLMAIMAGIAANSHDQFAPDALETLTEPLTRYYTSQKAATDAGDVVRIIDELGNGRFARLIVEKARIVRNRRVVDAHGLSEADLSDETVGDEVEDDAFATLTAEDVDTAHQQALPPEYRRQSP